MAGILFQDNVKQQKPKFNARPSSGQSSSGSPWFGRNRPKWLGPLQFDAYPTHLEGSAPADYGFDPLKLSAAPQDFDRYLELELLHARWAMLGALGVFVPDLPQSRWWNVGYAKAVGDEDLNYLGVSGFKIAGGQGILIIAVCQVLLMFGPEYARACGIEALEPFGIHSSGDKNYPGGVFDPLNLSKDPRSFEDLKVKELKNGRLAMVAWLGFFAQAAWTRQGPVENLIQFTEDPATNNILTVHQ
eukprot:jgi/Astpho2/3407/Aster-04740